MSAAGCCAADWRVREQLVRSRSRAKNEIHAVLQRRLQGKPPCSDLFGVKGRAWLADWSCPLEERESIDAGIRHVDFLDSQRSRAQRSAAWRSIQGRRECKPRRTRLQARLGSAAGATTAPGYPCLSEAATILTQMLPSFVTAAGQMGSHGRDVLGGSSVAKDVSRQRPD
jgi:hypothetical protein